MKKVLKTILAIALLIFGVVALTGCQNTPDEIVEPTPTPAPTEPAWEPGLIRAGYGHAVLEEFNYGDRVKILGEVDGYYIVEGTDTLVLVETRYLRADTEEAFTAVDHYARNNIQVYETAYLDGEPIATLKLNTKVHIVEGKENWYRIEWGENMVGYVDKDDLSKWKITGGGGSSGGGGGGSRGPADGTDINLGELSAEAEETPTAANLLIETYGDAFVEMDTEGTILTNEAEGNIYLYDRDETAKVTVVGEEECEVYIDGITATSPRWLLHMEGDADYAPWTGYAVSKAVVYERWQMREIYVKATLKQNTEVYVIDELPNCYVVEYNGEIGYMNLDDVKTKKIVTYSGGGSGGSGGGGGGNADWTPPAL